MKKLNKKQLSEVFEKENGRVPNGEELINMVKLEEIRINAYKKGYEAGIAMAAYLQGFEAGQQGDADDD